MAAPFWSGKNAKLIVLIDGTKVVLDVITWDVKQSATVIADDVCGEDRSRLQKIINFYELKFSCKQVGVDDLKALLKYDDNGDANVLPLTVDAAYAIKPNDGTSAAFQGREITIDDWSWASGGRAERQTLEIPMRARYFGPLQTL